MLFFLLICVVLPSFALSLECDVFTGVTVSPAGLGGDIMDAAWQKRSYMGYRIAMIGDIDGNGFEDVCISPYNETDSPWTSSSVPLQKYSPWTGAVYMVFMGASEEVIDIQKISHSEGGSAFTSMPYYNGYLIPGDKFGSGITPLGDIDGDNIPDLLVGALGGGPPGQNNEGALYILTINNDGTVKHATHISMTEEPMLGLGQWDSFGWYTLKGDGFIAVSAPYRDVEKGSVFILDLQLTGIETGYTLNGHFEINATTLDALGLTLDASDRFGMCIAYGEDYNGDGVKDLVVTAYNADDDALPYSTVYIVHMDNTNRPISVANFNDLLAGVSVLTDEDRNQGLFGCGLAVLSDVDDNGFMELAVGAAYHMNYLGSVFIFFMGNNEVLSEHSFGAISINGVDIYQLNWWGQFGFALANAGDRNGDGIDDLLVTEPGNSDLALDTGGFRIIYVTEMNMGLSCPCDSNPCNDGMCDNLNLEDSFVCDCTDTGFDGDTCTTDADDCASSPCLNGGVCTDYGTNMFGCSCASTGFKGTVCETDADDCQSSPCENGGFCSDTGLDAFSCNCTGSGYEGETCTTDVDDCASSPCVNGKCVDGGVHNFSCVCTAGYEGDICQNDINDCASDPCFNAGICTDAFNDYVCDCTGTGYEGDMCATDVDDCASSPCLNLGICSDAGAHAYQCNCAGTGYDGDICASDVDDCLSSPCIGGEECADTGVNSFACTFIGESTSSPHEPNVTEVVVVVVTYTVFEGDFEQHAIDLANSVAQDVASSSPNDITVEVLQNSKDGYVAQIVYIGNSPDVTPVILQASVENAVEDDDQQPVAIDISDTLLDPMVQTPVEEDDVEDDEKKEGFPVGIIIGAVLGVIVLGGVGVYLFQKQQRNSSGLKSHLAMPA